MIDFWPPIIEAVAKALPWALGIIAALGLGMARYRSGKRDARRETALEAAERMAKLERERGTRDAEIQEDTDLVDRARRAGVVRGEGAE